MVTEPVVGRTGVLTRVLDVLNRDERAGRAGALLLTGEHGIGRTTCLSQAKAAAEADGCLTLETSGTPDEGHLPFAGLQRLLAPALHHVGKLPTSQQRALLAALGMRDAAGADRLAVFVGTLSLLREAAGPARLLVVIDDAEWLDPETRQALAFIARRLDRGMTAVASCTTAAEVGELADAFDEIPLRRLDDSDARWLIAHHGGRLSEERRAWVARQAMGNPLALRELVELAADVDVTPADPLDPGWSLTPRLLRAFSPRSPLTGCARDTALVAALAMEPELAEILAAATLLCGRPVDAGVLESARASGTLRIDDVRVHFAHPLVKAAIVQQESVSRRQRAHRALGAVITVSAHRRAWHRAYGVEGTDEPIADELESTADDCLRRGDVPRAVLTLERAAQLTADTRRRGRRYLAAARHAARLGRPEVVHRLIALAAADELTPAERMRADLLREDFDGAVIREAGRVVRLCSAAETALAANDRSLALDLAEAAARRRCAGPVDERTLRRLRSLAVGLASATEDAQSALVLALADPVAHARAVASALSAVDRCAEVDASAWSDYGAAARAIGDYSTSAALLDVAIGELRSARLLGPLARHLGIAADVRLELGDWAGAASALDEFASLSSASMSASHRSSTATSAAKLAALRGDVDAALKAVSDLEHTRTSRSNSRLLARARIVRGVAHLAASEHGDAYETLSRVVEPGDPSYHFREHWDGLTYFVEAASHVGQHAAARAVVDRMRGTLAVSGSPILSTHLAYADAVLATDAMAERMFLAAAAFGTSGSPWHRARIQLAHGQWLRRQKRVIESRQPLRAALLLLEELGARRWASEARDELEATGAPVEETTSELGNVLSPQELRIAMLAAEGMSNKEIGARLYLSPRTISSHLYRIFPKLGISGRAQLAVELGLVPAVDETARSARVGR